MAKNVKESAQVKGRQTKLSKKTAEELIEIILRKDKTEKNLSNNVKSLKAEVNSLTSKLENAKNDAEGTEHSLSLYKDKVDTLLEQLDDKARIISECKDEIEKAIRDARYTKLELKFWRCAGGAAVIICIVLLCLW